jgi:hypothetical protein
MLVRKLLCLALIFGLTLFQTQTGFSHSGGTNAEGCHTNRQTGDYHCHTPKSPPAGSDTYCHVVDGERRCGYSRGTCNDLASRYGGYCQRQ